MAKTKMKIVRTMKIDPDKCTGCGACSVICSASHAEPKYSTVNPKRSRIRIFRDEENDLYIPILSGPYTETECNARTAVFIKNKEYGECSFCRCSCPSRDLFREPDSGLSLRCDMCEGEDEPLCVEWCLVDALTYEEREEEVEEEERPEDLEIGLESLVHKYGMDKLVDTLARMSESKTGRIMKTKQKHRERPWRP